MNFDLETMDLEILKQNYPKEFQEERDDDDEYLFTNDEYNTIKRKTRSNEESCPKQGLYFAQAHYSDEHSHDDPMYYDFPENVLTCFSYQLTHLLHQEAFTRYQNLLINVFCDELKENIAWFYRYPNLIILSEDIKPYLYRLLKEMGHRLDSKIISLDYEMFMSTPQDIVWAYEPDEEINPEPWAQKDLGEKRG